MTANVTLSHEEILKICGDFLKDSGCQVTESKLVIIKGVQDQRGDYFSPDTVEFRAVVDMGKPKKPNYRSTEPI